MAVLLNLPEVLGLLVVVCHKETRTNGQWQRGAELRRVQRKLK